MIDHFELRFKIVASFTKLIFCLFAIYLICICCANDLFPKGMSRTSVLDTLLSLFIYILTLLHVLELILSLPNTTH